MAWKVILNPETGFIEETFSDKVSMQDVSEATAKSLTLVDVETPLKFFVNILDADIDISVVELFKIPESWDTLGFGRENSMSVLMSESTKQAGDLSFFEDVSVNRGWNVKIFTVKKQAVEWLTQQHPSSPK